MALLRIFAAGTLVCAGAFDPLDGTAARTGAHLGPRGVSLEKALWEQDFEDPLADTAARTGAHLGPRGVSLNETLEMKALEGPSELYQCPANFPVCYYDGDCVISSCAHGCPWRYNSNYIHRYTRCTQSHAASTGVCPANFPVCYFDGDCVISSCRGGCPWRYNSNYMHGSTPGHYTRCRQSHSLVTAGTCPPRFPVCYSDGDCVIRSCAHGCFWRLGSNYIHRPTRCNHNYGAIETPELSFSTGVAVFAMAAVPAALLTLAAVFMVRRRSAPKGHQEPLLVTDL